MNTILTFLKILKNTLKSIWRIIVLSYPLLFSIALSTFFVSLYKNIDSILRTIQSFFELLKNIKDFAADNLVLIGIFTSIILLVMKFYKEGEELSIKHEKEEEIDILNSTEPLNWKTFESQFESTKSVTKNFDDFLNRLKKGKETQIISLVSAWGAGKTSFFRMVKGYYLNNKHDLKLSSEIKFYEYNPWISQTKNITEDFLNYLKSIIYTETGKLIDTEINNYIVSLYDNLPNSPFSSINGIFGNQKISFQLRKQQILKRYNEVLEKKANFRLVILIDDIDRLRPEEVLTIVELIKEVSDFPQITFVLAYEKRLLNDLLIKATGFDVEQVKQYLQKIIEEQFLVKFGESTYHYIKNIFYNKIISNTELKGHTLYKSTPTGQFNIAMPKNVNGTKSEWVVKNIEFWRIILVETFRKKYLELLKNNIGVEEANGVLIFKDDDWFSFKQLIDINDTNPVDNSFWNLSRFLNSKKLDNQSFITDYKGKESEDISGMDIFLHHSTNILYAKIGHEEFKSDNKNSEQNLFEAVEGKLTIRFLKQLLKEIEMNIESQNSSLENFEEVQPFVRLMIDNVWDK